MTKVILAVLVVLVTACGGAVDEPDRADGGEVPTGDAARDGGGAWCTRQCTDEGGILSWCEGPCPDVEPDHG